MAKNIYDKLKKIEVESCNIDVTKYRSDRKADNDRLIREFNKGKSFEFNE
jgi:pyrimidine operon attenuation protein/uracil phosphoribosyltransferase